MQKVEDLKNHTAKNNILKRQVYTECISSIFFFQFTSAGTAPGKKKSWGSAESHYFFGLTRQRYGVALASRLLKIIGLFCKRAL